MPATLRDLFANSALSLAVVVPGKNVDSASVNWVHSSELDDPTPFLSPGNVLLTTGSQWAASGGSDLSSYVRRLVGAEVPAIGFGVGLTRESSPRALVDACEREGIALFEVPYDTPFIAVAQAVATTIADERYARNTWSLKAQRAIARAAVRPDGLHACLRELAVQLGEWVCLTDATGGVVILDPPSTSETIARLVSGEAAHLLARSSRASGRITQADESFSIQTIGSANRFHGTLAVGESREADHATTEVVDCVVALVGLSLEHRHALADARMTVRTAALSLALAGETDLANTVGKRMWDPLPALPVVLVADPGLDRLDYVAEWLELRSSGFGRPFFARSDAELVIVISADRLESIQAALAGENVDVGVAHCRSVEDLQGALIRARVDLHSGRPGQLGRGSGREIGNLLADYDRVHHTALVDTLRAWFDTDCTNERAADLLGVHRHTLRARLRLAGSVVDRDLGRFTDRAVVWSALSRATDFV